MYRSLKRPKSKILWLIIKALEFNVMIPIRNEIIGKVVGKEKEASALIDQMKNGFEGVLPNR